MNFSNAKAIISGGASGLGLGVAKAIIAAGGQVVILDLNADAGKRVATELGSRARFQHTDITDEHQVDNAVDAATKQLDGINLAVSCAGILGNARLLGRNGPMSADFFRTVINVNLIGAFLLTRAAARVMAATTHTDSRGERGVIVHTASIAAYEGQFGQAAYAATKSGVVGMILPLARELAGKGIRIMAVAPGMFETPMLNNVSDEIREQLCSSVPFPARFGTPAEYAAMVEHIFSNQMLNGSVIRLDGAARLQ